MTRALVERWFNRLPESEKDLPLLIVSGNAYTPRAALSEVQRGTSLGNQLQALIERGSFGTNTLDERALATLRLKRILALKPDKPLFATLTIPAKTYTPSQLISEVEAGTPAGEQWIRGEIQTMRRVLSVR